MRNINCKLRIAEEPRSTRICNGNCVTGPRKHLISTKYLNYNILLQNSKGCCRKTSAIFDTLLDAIATPGTLCRIILDTYHIDFWSVLSNTKAVVFALFVFKILNFNRWPPRAILPTRKLARSSITLVRSTIISDNWANSKQSDRDKSGKISRAEIKEGLRALKLPSRDKDVDDFLRSLDTDHDGEISFEVKIIIIQRLTKNINSEN